MGRIWRSNRTAYRALPNQRRRALPRCVRIKRREEARCCSNESAFFTPWTEKSGSSSFSLLLMLASPINSALICAGAVDQNADIGPYAIGQIVHRDLLIGAMKPREIGLRHDERVKAVGIISDLTVVLAVRSRNH